MLILIYAGFISLGLPDGSFGVAWPAAYPKLDLPIWLAGVVTTVGTLLTTIAGFSSGRIIGRWQTGPVVLVSCAMTGSGLLILANAQSGAWLFLAAVPLGLGAGAVDAGLNSYVAKHYSGRHMNWLHACWGVGAAGGPVLMGLALGTDYGWRGGYGLLGGLQLALAGVFLATLGLWRAVPERHAGPTAAARDAARPTMPASSFAGWLAPGLFTLYVAAEATLIVWSGTVLVVQRGLGAQGAAVCTALLLGALTVGRVTAGLVVDRWGNRRLVRWGVGLAVVGVVVFGLAPGGTVAGIGLALAGFGLAPVYPCLMHEVPRRFAPEAVAVVIGRQSGAASLGAATLPALAGWVAGHALSAVPWVVLTVLVLLAVALRRLNQLT